MTTEILNKEIVNYIINDVELTIKRLASTYSCQSNSVRITITRSLTN